MKKLILIIILVLMTINFVSATYNAHGKPFTGSSSPTTRNGLELKANNTVILRQIIKNAGSTATLCYLYDGSKTQIASGSFAGNNCSINYRINKGSTYYAMVDKGGAGYIRPDTDSDASFPYKAPDLNFTNPCYDWVGGTKACGGSEIHDVSAIITENVNNITTTLNYPKNQNGYIVDEIKFNVSINTKGYSLVNTTFNVWYANGSLFNKTINTTFTSKNNSIIIIDNFAMFKNYKWNAKTCGTNATGYLCSYSKNYTFATGWNASNIKYNSTTVETESEMFKTNLSVLAGYTPTNALLIWNGTKYSASISNLGGNQYLLYKTIDIPLSNKSISWHFNWTINNIPFSSQSINQSVSRLHFSLCNATYKTKFLNISFKDESTLAKINASISYSLFTYFLGTGTVNKTYTYSNSVNKYNYTFCASPNRTLNVIPYIQYKQGTDYPQRLWNPSVQQYTNTVTNKVLYLLNSINGIYVTFQVVNAVNQVISGVFVNATREISGTNVLLGSGTTGADGTTTFWLNPDFIHTISAFKTGYPLVTLSLTPTQSSYTITLGSQATTFNNTFQGIRYYLRPNETSLVDSLVNDTDYTFGLTINSEFWDLDEYGFNLRLANGSIISGGSTTTEGDPLTLVYNTGNQSVIYMDYYWVINGEYTNLTRYWVVYNTEHTEYSIWKFFIDLNAYLSAGMFGIDNFGRVFLVFLILFISVGLVSYKYGIVSPMAVASLMWAIIFFFDVVVDLIPSFTGINHLPTYIVSLILALVIFREVQT